MAALTLAAGVSDAVSEDPSEMFRAGAASVDITPEKLPVISSGGFLARTGTVIRDRLFARGLALDDGTTQIVFVVADTLFVPGELCDEVKEVAKRSTGIAPDNILIAATHTHSAGCLVGCLGSDTDRDYVDQVRRQLVECIEQSLANLQPAQIGWSSVIDAQHTHNRVFIRRPDCIGVDPFGEKTIRVMMHPGYQNPDYIGPSGPVDNELSLISVRTREGQPIAVLANYAMHYFGTAPISADYFGVFTRILTEQIAGGDESFVAMISNGTSADLHWMDYSHPKKNLELGQYAQAVATSAMRAYEQITYQDWVKLQVSVRRCKIDRRVPDPQRWAWAESILSEMKDDIPRNQQQVYAREAKYLREEPSRELTLQAIAIGDLGIAALPTETYALTGLKLKHRSPFSDLINIELANGAEGYIPPPEVLALGGYNAWPARTAGLQADAETQITDTLLSMLEDLAGHPRRQVDLASAPYARQILARKPLAYWRMGDMEGTSVADLSKWGHHGQLEPGWLFYLDGPPREDLAVAGNSARAIQFVGGRMHAELPALGNSYSVEMFFWNGLSYDNRAVTAYLFSRGPGDDTSCPGDHLGIGGIWEEGKLKGRLFFYNGNERAELLSGGPVIEPKTWNHVRLVRQGQSVSVYLNFDAEPIVSGEVSVTCPATCREVYLGGRSDNFAPLEGRLSEVAVWSSSTLETGGK
jgi:hypothetical protein